MKLAMKRLRDFEYLAITAFSAVLSAGFPKPAVGGVPEPQSVIQSVAQSMPEASLLPASENAIGELPDGIDGQAGSDDAAYSEGTRAIQESRWADAESVFDKVAQRHGDHTEGALYWKAYAENKLGKTESALKSCAALRQSYPKSRWADDCGALEIEIRSKSGQAVDPQSEKDESLKLLALNALMHQNATKALPQAQQILSSSDSEIAKEQVLFVLAQNGSKGALNLLAQVAHPGADSPADIRSNEALQQRAQQMLAAMHGAAGESVHTVRRVGLDVVVANADGKPVSGLKLSDFTILDNEKETKIEGFHEFGEQDTSAGSAGDMTVLILFDTVNSSLVDIAYARDQVEQYLRQDGGKLAHPVELLAFNGNGAQSIAPVSRDGNALADALEKSQSNLHPIRRSEAFWGAVERLQLSLNTLDKIAADEARTPGRKLLFWLAPGWPMLIGTQFDPSSKELRTFFDAIVSMSYRLRLARIALYSLDPDRNAGSNFFEWNYYKGYLKGVPDAKHAAAANLALQVLATQSGGKVINYRTKDIWQDIASNIANAGDSYFLVFNSAAAARLDEYHSLKITVDKPGFTVQARSGYYDEP
jgi:VWFA-related protein